MAWNARKTRSSRQFEELFADVEAVEQLLRFLVSIKVDIAIGMLATAQEPSQLQSLRRKIFFEKFPVGGWVAPRAPGP